MKVQSWTRVGSIHGLGLVVLGWVRSGHKIFHLWMGRVESGPDSSVKIMKIFNEMH